MSATRKLRAQKMTFIMGAILSIVVVPFIYIYSTRTNYSAKAPLKTVEEFVVQDRKGEFFTHFSLKNKITLLIVSSTELSEKLKSPLMRLSERLEQWALSEFKPAHNQPNAFQLVAITKDDLQNELPKSWRQISFENNYFAKVFFLENTVPNKPSLVLVDQEGQVRLIQDVTQASETELERFSSALVFNHHLSDYLSKRTFMGPIKNIRKDL